MFRPVSRLRHASRFRRTQERQPPTMTTQPIAHRSRSRPAAFRLRRPQACRPPTTTTHHPTPPPSALQKAPKSCPTLQTKRRSMRSIRSRDPLRRPRPTWTRTHPQLQLQPRKTQAGALPSARASSSWLLVGPRNSRRYRSKPERVPRVSRRRRLRSKARRRRSGRRRPARCRRLRAKQLRAPIAIACGRRHSRARPASNARCRAWCCP
mmetsp:Transcript_6144/g.13125  ORF Transcript_6144/g.13125 Transcript_6144/m.13125 type:complete len:209 (+) Transcript_6144:560-1186(+)